MSAVQPVDAGAIRHALVEAAEAAHAAVERSPAAAAAQARAIVRDAAKAGAAEAQVAALHALGYAQYQLADPDAAATLRAAIRRAERTGLQTRAAFARRLLAGIYADRGNVKAALREIDRACEGLTGADLARAQTVRLAVLANLGREPIDLRFTDPALRVLRRAGDLPWQARLLQNRALVRWNRGDPRAASDLLEARSLWSALDAPAATAIADVLLMRIALSRDDIVEALRRLSAIETAELTGRIKALVDGHGGRVLLAARLFDEANDAFTRAEAMLEEAKTDASALEERLELARLFVAVGRYDEADRAARSIARSATARGNPLLAARARALAAAAATHSDTVDSSEVRRVMRAIEIFVTLGRSEEAARARLTVARLELKLGRPALADLQLRAVDSAQLPIIDRIDACAIEAMLRERRGDATGALRALHRGLRALGSHQGAFGAVELRVAAAGAGVELASLGLRIAARKDDAHAVLAWAEALRSNSLRLPAVHPPTDARLAALQVELRRVVARIQESDARNLPRQWLVRRQAELETAVRRYVRSKHGPGDRPFALPRFEKIASALEGHTLIEYVELDGRLFALTQAGGRLELHELGAVDPAAELEWLRFSLSRLARGGLGAAQAATLANARASAAALDRMLVAPLLDAIGDAPLVVVPTGALHALPWSALPSLRSRPITVAPSLSTWVELHRRRPRRNGAAALVAGPRLRHARREVRELAESLPAATVLTGKEATVDATLAALDGASLAHIACHGRFRADSPLFSALELADGPLTALDLQRIRRAPDVLVLSACDVALSKRHPGDELLGLSAALIAAGTRSIVASVVPVPDAAARRLMLAFHRHVAAGASPAAALAAAQAGLRADRSALAGVVCLGAG